MNPFRNSQPKKKAPVAPYADVKKVGTSNGYMKIKKPNIKIPSAHEVLEHGTPGDNQNFNK